MKLFLKKIKEKIVNSKNAKSRLNREKIKSQQLYKMQNGDENITILTPNCVAGEIYNILGLKFNSPTINCSFEKQKYFINFCCHLDEYLKIKPIMTERTYGYPRMVLKSKIYGDIYINWPHDSSNDIVIENWEKRKGRIIKDKLYIITSNNYLDDSDIDKLNEVKSLNTIIFTNRPIKKKNTYFVKKYRHSKLVGKYNFKKLNGLYVFMDFFDFVDFLVNPSNMRRKNDE